MSGRRVLAGLVAGLLFTATLPPFGWWPLGLVGVAVLHVALRGAAAGTRVAVGLAAGVGLYGPGLWWATSFHAAGWVAIVVLESLLLAGAMAVVPGRRAGGLAAVASLPAALVVAEAVRGQWPFGGLPLAGLDLGQVGGPLLPVARVGGHLLVVGVMGLAGVGLAELVRAARGRAAGVRRFPPGALGLGLAVVAAAAGVVAPDGTDRGPLTVAAVQGGGPRGLRAVGRDPRPVFDAQLAATRRLSSTPVLVLWPEDVVDVEGVFAGSPEEAEAASLARELGVTLVAGIVEDGPGTLRSRNAAVVFGPDGRVLDRYDKVHRVPFGEYVPYRSLFYRVADLSDVPRDAIAGRGPAVLDTPAGRVGVVISFEVFFADRAREAAREGGRLLLVPTNASSYTSSQVPTQEVATARVRAVETGRWVVQAAPTGYSAVIDARGRVRARGPLGDAAVLEAAVRLQSGRTVAVRLGDTPVLVLAAALLGLAWIQYRKVESTTGSFVA